MKTNQDSTISFAWENFKMINITSKYFGIFNNKPLASLVTHITDFLHVIPVRIIVPWSWLAVAKTPWVKLPLAIMDSQIRDSCGWNDRMQYLSYLRFL